MNTLQIISCFSLIFILLLMLLIKRYKIRLYFFFHSLREYKKGDSIFSRGVRCNIITTIQCPYKCSYCPMYIYGVPKKYPHCTFDEWKAYFDRFPLRLSAVYISGGEPALYPDIIPLVNYLAKKGHHVIIQTNLYNVKPFEGIKPRKNILFMATYHQKEEERLKRGNRFFENYCYLKDRGHLIISQQIGEFNPQTDRIKEFFTEKWFKEMDNSIVFEPSTPRTLRMWTGCVNMYKK